MLLLNYGLKGSHFGNLTLMARVALSWLITVRGRPSRSHYRRSRAICQILCSFLGTLLTILFLFAALHRRLSDRQMVSLSCLGWLLVALSLPVGNYLAIKVDEDNVAPVVKYASLGLWVAGRLMGFLWWPYVHLTVTESSIQQLLFISILPESKHRVKGMGLSKQIGSGTAFVNSMLFGYLWSE